MLPVPFGRQGSFPKGQGSPEHAGCWAACLELGTSLGQSLRIPPLSLLAGRAYLQHKATPGTAQVGGIRDFSHQDLKESTGRARHRGGFPGSVAQNGASWPQDGISAATKEPRACTRARGSIHKALERHKDRHQHITEAHHQAGSQGCSGDQLQPPTSHLPAARPAQSQGRQPTQLHT